METSRSRRIQFDGAVRIALIGSGKMAAVHAANMSLTPAAHLVAVAGGSGAADLADRHGAVVLAVDEAIDRDDIDAVVIASPNRFHAEQITAAATRGKAVLVEKPVDLDVKRVDACIRAVGSAADRVVVAFNRRFDPSFASVRTRIDEGEIGDVEQVVIVSRDPAPPSLDYVPGSGGIFRDMTIHDLDMARFLVGDIRSVHAVAQFANPELAALEEPSGAIVTLISDSGGLVTIVDARSNAFGYDQRLEAFGAGGSLAVSNVSITSVTASAPGWVRAQSPAISHYGDRYREAYAAEIRHLVAVTKGEERPRASLADGRAALMLADAATVSSQGAGAITVGP